MAILLCIASAYIYVSTNLDPLLHIQIQIPVYPVIKVIIRSNMFLFNLIAYNVAGKNTIYYINGV